MQHAAFLVAACTWDLVPQPGIEPRPLALGVRSLTHRTTREVPTEVVTSVSKWSYPYKTSQTTEILVLFQEQNLPLKKKFHNFFTVEILSTSDNFPCQEMFDIFQNAPKHPIDCLYEKKNLTLLFIYLSFISFI